MRETNAQAEVHRESKERRRNNRGFAKGLIQSVTANTEDQKQRRIKLILSVILWIGLAYGAYAFAAHYMQTNQANLDERIAQIEGHNQEQIKSVESQLNKVQEDLSTVQQGMQSINEELALTGKTIGGTNKTKQALEQRIDQLNKQLNELKGSLKKLEDAARAW